MRWSLAQRGRRNGSALASEEENQ